MKIKSTILLLLLLICSESGLTQSSSTYLFTKSYHFPSTGEGYGQAFPISATSFYTMGEFGGTMDFDPSPGTLEVNAQNEMDAFIARYSDNGQIKWYHTFEATPGSRLKVLAGETNADGNLTVVGTFTGRIDIAPSPDVMRVIDSEPDEWDGFVATFDVFGNLLWGFSIGSNCQNCPDEPKEDVSFVQLDDNGNILIGGHFAGTADFDPYLGQFLLTSNGDLDIFIAKYDEFGAFIGAASYGGPEQDHLTGMTINRDKEIFLSGGFRGDISFDPLSSNGDFVSVGGSDYFLVKLDAAFNFAWGFSGGNEADDMFKNVQLDSEGNIYTACTIEGMVDFDPTDIYFNLASGLTNDVAMLKYSPSGQLLWGFAINAPGIDNASIAFIDELDHPCFALDFELGGFDLDPGPGLYPLLDLDNIKTICRLNPDGNLKQAFMFNDTDDGRLTIEGAQHLNQSTFMSLAVTGSADVDPTEEVEIVASASANVSDMVIVEVKAELSVLPVDWTRFVAYPNYDGVILDWETAREVDNAGFEVQRSKDGVNWEGLKFIPGQPQNTAALSRYSWFDEYPFEGNNYYRLKQIDLNGAYSYSSVQQVYFEGYAGNYQFGVFPNPVSASGQVNLSLPGAQPGTPVQLYGMQGQLLNQFIVGEGKTLVDLGTLPAGQYLLSAEVGNSVLTKRLIVK